MTSATGPQDSELRRTLDQQVIDMETAIAISEEAAKVDQPSPDGDPLLAVLTSDVLDLIRSKMESGRITASVIYFVARYSIGEMEDHLRRLDEQTRQRMSAIARRPRQPRVDEDVHDRVVAMGQRLRETHSLHEIVGTISQHISDAPSQKTIRKYLRESRVIPEVKKKGT